MKTIKFIFILILINSLISCDKKDNIAKQHLDVETFIVLLKTNQYDSINLPAFAYKDIPALLQYRNADQTISNFPHNPISSLYSTECKLGIYVLWTIESIRAVSINSEYLIMRFPSQNPILAIRNSDELAIVSDNESHTTVAKAYYDWWENNRNKDFEEFNSIDPLENTDYKWH
jgi:hypothetical protein